MIVITVLRVSFICSTEPVRKVILYSLRIYWSGGSETATSEELVDLFLIIRIELSTGDDKLRAMSGISGILQSVEKLEQSVLCVDKKKLTDLRPAAVTGFRVSPLLSIQSELPQLLPKLYQCCNCKSFS